MKIHITLLLAFIILSTACTKNNDDDEDSSNPPVTFTGYVYSFNDSTPLANTSFIMYQRKEPAPSTGYVPEEEIVPFTTDENGYFLVDFKLISLNGIHVCWPDYPDCGIDNFMPAVSPPQVSGTTNMGILYIKKI